MARYTLRQRLIAIGEDFDITDEHGTPVFHVDGKALRFRSTFVIEDMHGNEQATIREKKLALRDSMMILRDGDTLATIRKGLLTLLREHYDIVVEGGDDLVAQGDVLDHEYEIQQNGDTIAHISKRWFTMRDTYGIETVAGADDTLILAVAVALDDMEQEANQPNE